MATETAPTTTVATQLTDPWRATKRTVFAVAAAAYPVLIILAEILREIGQTYEGVIPANLTALAFSAATFLTLTAGLVTRIMNIPGVNAALAKLNLDANTSKAGTAPKLEYKPLTTIPNYPKK